LLKRTIILFVILAIIDLIFIKKAWIVFVGLLTGYALSCIRFSFMESFYIRILATGNKNIALKKSVKNFILGQLVTIAFLVLTMIINMGLFTGAVAGILIVPTIIFINAATEGFGITHNNFE
jgi:hypothetical protein